MLMSIEGMDCPSCASKVTRALLTLPSVRDVKVNSFAGQASLAYTEGLVFPAHIAKRAQELTGFACGVLEEIQPQGEYGAMRVSVPATMDVNWEKVDLPSTIAIKSFKRSAKDIVLDIEYNTSDIQPRSVLAAFSPWEGSFVPTPKARPSDQAGKELITLLRRTIISAIFCIPVLVFSWAPLPDNPNAYGGASLGLATVIQAYVAAPLYSSALRSLFLQHILDMDLLVILSSTIAYSFSAIAYFLLVAGHPFSEPFFETPALLITLITLGRLISAYARRRATSALDDVRSLQADTVELLDKGGIPTTISAELVHKDDILLIAPDTLIPTDGTVSFGNSHVDESSITGEGLTVEKLVGSKLTAGTLNGSGVLHMQVERLPSDNTISDIGKLMLEVQDARLPVQDLADKIASYLAPVILVTSLITFGIWMAIGMTVRHQSSNTAGIAALRYAISVMVISCPCALVLCVPMVVVIATGVAGKAGVLFKSAQAVQYAKDVKVAVFDKTGTLTTGTLEVVEAHIPSDESIAAVLGLVSASRHPVAQAVYKHLSALHPTLSPRQFKDVQSVAGQGMEARASDQIIRGGNPTWLGLEAHPVVSKMQGAALTMFTVTSNASLLEHVRALQGSSTNKTNKTNKKTKVMFIGDGTNDSLALAQADVGVSLGSGTDIALSAADIVVLTSSSAAASVDLARALRTLFAISRGAVRRIGLNFAWSFVYNAVAVLLAAGAFVKVRIAPEYAGLGEMVSVVPVVAIAWSMWLLRR
ncbi:heavy metal translocatin [Amylostereum chailletii]|nr:heavy metal translocatin [Amylostereum chailletii]